MTKKVFLFAIVLFAFASVSTADDIVVKPRPIVPGGNGTHPRVPMNVPSLYIEGHTLSFDEFYLGYTLQLVQDDQVVFTYQILTTDDLELPDTLSGEYELQLVGPVYTFVGIVEL